MGLGVRQAHELCSFAHRRWQPSVQSAPQLYFSAMGVARAAWFALVLTLFSGLQHRPVRGLNSLTEGDSNQRWSFSGRLTFSPLGRAPCSFRSLLMTTLF